MYVDAVKVIKEAILRSQYRAASHVNKEQLSLYYGIGRYVSENSRVGFWGKSAIETISLQLQKELPGLRGFSPSNIKNMRQFYEEWYSIINRQPSAGDLKTQAVVGDIKIDESLLLKATDKSEVVGFEWSNFFAISFSHHVEIISKAKTLEARLFYIYESATRFWNKYTLRDYLNADLYSHRGLLPNNFTSSYSCSPYTKTSLPFLSKILNDLSVFSLITYPSTHAPFPS